MSAGTELFAGTTTADELRSLQQVGSLQRVETDFATAMSVQIPRTLSTVEKRLIEEANIACEAFYYAWGAGKDRVEGPSVGLAMSLARLWGNCALQLRPVQDLVDSWVFTACFVDLETGFTLERQFRQSKNWKVYGKFDEARKEDIRFQIGQSKAVRNVITNALPRWLTAKALDAAKRGVRQKVLALIGERGEEEVRESAVAKLGELGVPEDRVLAKFGRETVKALSVEDLVLIWGDINALTNGLDTAEHLYPVPKQSLEQLGGAGAQSLADALETGGRSPDDSDVRPVGPDESKAEPPPAESEAKPEASGKTELDGAELLVRDLLGRLQRVTTQNAALQVKSDTMAAQSKLGIGQYTDVIQACDKKIAELKPGKG